MSHTRPLVIVALTELILAAIVIHTIYDALFSLPPLLSAPFSQNIGFVPLLASVALILYWASDGTPWATPSVNRTGAKSRAVR